MPATLEDGPDLVGLGRIDEEGKGFLDVADVAGKLPIHAIRAGREFHDAAPPRRIGRGRQPGTSGLPAPKPPRKGEPMTIIALWYRAVNVAIET
jgi:hypothetical protein